MLRSIIGGLKTTYKHLFAALHYRKHKGVVDHRYFREKDGIVTIQYPRKTIPIPEQGRYALHVEMDDCIVCDLCAKICPVDCIEIESIKAVQSLGKTSDGTVKRLHAAKFYIDHAKCMFCGLCTTVCPTECIIMTDTFDVSVHDVKDLKVKFSEMSSQEAGEKRELLEKVNKERAAAKAEAMKRTLD